MLGTGNFFNIEYVDVEKFCNPSQRPVNNTSTHKAGNAIKKSLQRIASLKVNRNSNKQALLADDNRQSEMQHDELTEEELIYALSVAQSDSPSNERIKVFLRCNYWPSTHQIRKYLWRCLLKLPKLDTKSEVDYLSDLSKIFGKSNLTRI